MVDDLEKYLNDNLHLRLNKNKQIFRFEKFNPKTGRMAGRAINCLGYIIHRDRFTIRKSILKRIRAKANRMKKKGRTTRYDAAAMISYMGWIKHTDTYKYYLRWIKPKVSIRYCKRRIATLAKKEHQKEVMK